MNTEVEYREVENYPAYRVGNDGSVWSRYQMGRVAKGGSRCLQEFWKRLRPARTPKGYLYFFPQRNGVKEFSLVHHLVLEAFVGQRPEGMEGCHNNGNRADNRLENLRWDTHVGNMKDKILHGTHLEGERHPMHVLSANDVDEIRAMFRSGMTGKAISDLFGVNKTTVNKILNGTSWRRGEPRINRLAVDIEGKTFGRLTAIRRIGSGCGGIVWECTCACGGSRNVFAGKLRNGSIRSCGSCMRWGRVVDPNRDATIIAMRRSGAKLQEISQKFGISKQRVCEIANSPQE